MEHGPDRSGVRGLKVARRGDLIEDIHRQQRRRVFRRAAKFTTLAIVLLAAGVGVKVFADRHARTQALEHARGQFVGGTMGDLQSAVDVLSHSLQRTPDDAETQSILALARAHLWLEFGFDEQAARDEVGSASTAHPAGVLARAVLGFADGDVEGARTALSEIGDPGADPFLVQEEAWLGALVAIATGRDDPEVLQAAMVDVDAAREVAPEAVVLYRVAARLQLAMGEHDQALAELARARELADTHVGLAADEALYNAYVHRELAGVASVADQLLARNDGSLAPRDRAHAQLARAVAHVREGEFEAGLGLLDESFGGLAVWNHQIRRLALVTAAEAGDAERVRRWLGEVGLSEVDEGIFGAWATLLEGDVMKALAELEALPQEEPWVAYLQALALVEQRRFAEAKPWLERTEALLPGRIEVEVARSRVELRLGDVDKARRQLKALAEEEPYAPRAWTGLGEAYLLPGEGRDPKAARKALMRAVEREPIPAEATLLLGEAWYERRAESQEALPKALESFEKAAELNAHLPRYKERLAVALAELGYPERARTLFAELEDVPGVAAATLLTSYRLRLEQGEGPETLEPLLERAEEVGADPRDLERERARGLLTREDKPSASEALTRLLALLEADPADVDARVLCSMAQLKLGDRKSAETTIMRGFRDTPEALQGRLHFALARLQSRTGRWPKAAPRARRAWRDMLDEGRPPSELLEVAALATRAWIREGNESAAIFVARELTDRLGFHDEAWTIRARTELLGGEPIAGRSSAEKAVSINPDNPWAQAALGDALVRFGLKDEAIAAYRKAVELAEGTEDGKAFQDKLKRL